MNEGSISVKSEIFVNGVLMGTFHNTVLSAGLNLMGRRLFDSSYTTQALWICHTFSSETPATANAGTYTEVSTNVHKLEFNLTASLVNPSTWDSFHLMKANSILSADRIVTSNIATPIAINNTDTCLAVFTITFAGAVLNSNGFKILGHRCFNSANTYAPLNYITLFWSIYETYRVLGTYSNISDSVHRLGFFLSGATQLSDITLYNAASGGTMGMDLFAWRDTPCEGNHILEFTLANTASAVA